MCSVAKRNLQTQEDPSGKSLRWLQPVPRLVSLTLTLNWALGCSFPRCFHPLSQHPVSSPSGSIGCSAMTQDIQLTQTGPCQATLLLLMVVPFHVNESI